VDVAEVTVQVRDGFVAVEGTVVDRRMKHAIEDRVDGCVGVRDVDNRIKVMHPDPVPDGDAPPLPRADRPQDPPSARDAARGRFSEPMRGAAGKNG
jgi:hypothetical protein